jgi:hypothetical protein
MNLQIHLKRKTTLKIPIKISDFKENLDFNVIIT